MYIRPLLLFCVVSVSACTPGPTPLSGELLENHTPTAATLKGLLRDAVKGPFVAGSTERLRAIYDASQVTAVRWSTSDGVLEARGDAATWTLPAAGSADLTLSLVLQDGRTLDTPFTFQLQRRPDSPGVASASAALLATPMPVINGNNLEVTGGACDIAHDATGAIHLAFTSSTHPSVSYGRWNGSTWTIELVDGFGFNTGGSVDPDYVSMAIDSTGAPHLVYLLNSRVWYATRSGGAWIRESAAPTWVPDNYYANPAIALNPVTGEPTIAFTYAATSSQPRIAVARRRGTNAWTVSQPIFGPSSSTSYQSLRGDIIFDPAGVLYLATYLSNVSPFGSYIVPWRASSSTSDAFLLPSSVVENFASARTSLAWAGPSRLLVRTTSGVADIRLAATLANSTVTWSANEILGSTNGDMAWGNGLPTVLHQHGSALELVTPNAQGFWTYTQLGISSGVSAALSLHPTTGEANICYQANNRIMFQ